MDYHPRPPRGLMSGCFAGRFTICHKTEVIKNTLNPVWQSFTIPVRALCNGDYDRSENIQHHPTTRVSESRDNKTC